MFLHAGIVHLGLNMYVLAFTAPRVEYEFGTGRMLAIYFAGGLLASCSSVFSGAMKLSSAGLLTVSVGASGAVMALFGSLLTGLLLTPPRFAHLPRSQQPSLGRGLVQVVVINIGMGFVIQGVDNAAHVGGLIGGAVVGAIMAVAPGARGAGAMLARLLATTALVVACTGALLHGVDRPALLEMRAQVDADR
jgi:rhomboid protease GluP